MHMQPYELLASSVQDTRAGLTDHTPTHATLLVSVTVGHPVDSSVRLKVSQHRVHSSNSELK